MRRKPLGEHAPAHPLDFEIHLGHQVDGALHVDPDVAVEMGELDLARAQHDVDGRGEEPRIVCHEAPEG